MLWSDPTCKAPFWHARKEAFHPRYMHVLVPKEDTQQLSYSVKEGPPVVKNN